MYNFLICYGKRVSKGSKNEFEKFTPAIDYLKKIVSSPKNLNNISIKSLETIYIEIPFEEQVKLNSEITKSLNFNQSNEREKCRC